MQAKLPPHMLALGVPAAHNLSSLREYRHAAKPPDAYALLDARTSGFMAKALASPSLNDKQHGTRSNPILPANHTQPNRTIMQNNCSSQQPVGAAL
eukprot:900507-Amphidinium_carterae.1